MKTKSFFLAALIGCMSVAPLRAENNPGDSFRNTDVLPDSTVEQIVSTLNQFDGIEGLVDSSAVAIITNAKPYSLKDLERFILRVRPKSDADKAMEHENHIWSVFQPIIIVALVIALPLVAMFVFLGYRQRRRKDEEQMRQETLREMAKSGVTVTPEVIAAVYGKTTRRVMVKPAATGTAEVSSVAEKSDAEAATVYVDDPNEVKRMTEKSLKSLLLGTGFCFITFFASFTEHKIWAWVFLIPGFALIAQGGSYLLTRLLTKESESKTK
jgi:preprotein translocase subunit YajC